LAAAQPAPGGPPAAAKFVGRVSRLDLAGVRALAEAWQQLMRIGSDAWFAAERSVARAVWTSGRLADQDVMLEQMGECFRTAVWYRRPSGVPLGPAEARVGTTEATAQYVATTAMLALLVRDHVDSAEFAILYRPFATLIPDAELERE
jgi:hypothetical protein